MKLVIGISSCLLRVKTCLFGRLLCRKPAASPQRILNTFRLTTRLASRIRLKHTSFISNKMTFKGLGGVL